MVRADLMSLNRHFMEHGQPHAVAGFNSQVRKNQDKKLEKHLRENNRLKDIIKQNEV
jgi:hypothetical protein